MGEPRPQSLDTQVQDEASLSESRTLSRQSRLPSLTLPGYVFQQCLGDGAFGSVWLANEENTGRLVAVKIYSHQGRLDWTLLTREVEKLAALDSSRHIVGLLAVGWDSDPPYYIMEYLQNGSLAGYLSEGPLPIAEVVRIAHGVLQGLVHAHGRGILHCDLKPGNVLLDDDLSPRLCDFGQSRLTHEQDPALGTLYYMAPEQADLQAIPDARWDVYALGALLYHLLTGGPPHRTPEAEQRLASCESLAERLATYRQLVGRQPRPSKHRVKGIDRRLADIVDRCLRCDPSDRFPNAQAVLDAFHAREKQRARRPLIFLGGIAPLVLLAGMFVFGLTAMEDAVSTAQRTLVTRAMESHNVSAGIMARGVERELDQWRRELEQVAESEDFKLLVSETASRNWEPRNELRAHLDAARKKANTARKRQQRTPDASWFLVDAGGYQRWRGPHSPDTLDERWAHRDYYHGLDQEFARANLPPTISPIRKPHLSLAFRSQATNKSIVAQSVPVRNTAGDILAILAATRPLGNVLLAPYAEYKPRLGSLKDNDVNRTFAIVDSRNGRLLDHPWLQQQDNDANELSLSPQLIATLVSRRKNHNVAAGVARTDYRDPTAVHDVDFHGQWLAAFSPVGTTGWFTLVQERKHQALQPVSLMQSNILRTWLFALAASGSVITLMWILVLRSFGNPRSTAGLGTSVRPDGSPATALSTTPLEPPRA